MGQGFLTNRSRMSPIEGGVEQNYPNIEFFDVGFDINIGDWVFYAPGGLEYPIAYVGSDEINDAIKVVAMSSTRIVTIGYSYDGPDSIASPLFQLFKVGNDEITLLDSLLYTGLQYVGDVTWSGPGGAKASETRLLASFVYEDDYSSIDFGSMAIYLLSIAGDVLSVIDTTMISKKEIATDKNAIELMDMANAGNNLVAVAYGKNGGRGTWPNTVHFDEAKTLLVDTSAGTINIVSEHQIATEYVISADLTLFSNNRLMLGYTLSTADDDVRYLIYDISGRTLNVVTGGILVAVADNSIETYCRMDKGIDDNFIVLNADFSAWPQVVRTFAKKLNEDSSVTHLQSDGTSMGDDYVPFLEVQSSALYTVGIVIGDNNYGVNIVVYKNRQDGALEEAGRAVVPVVIGWEYISIDTLTDSSFILAFVSDNWTVGLIKISVGGGLRPATPEDYGPGLIGVAAGSGGAGSTLPVRMAY